ncbi:hypothetical protein [Magnetospira sp. QH-2]|uniref:hypothetical protein n=1 Tax=Magnetospira sp. (strain QH-2) TaxID=1288970 RepID=UPI0005FA6A3A|nr:hypothetical protein [Magnetospira sp. QH-2]
MNTLLGQGKFGPGGSPSRPMDGPTTTGQPGNAGPKSVLKDQIAYKRTVIENLINTSVELSKTIGQKMGRVNQIDAERVDRTIEFARDVGLNAIPLVGKVVSTARKTGSLGKSLKSLDAHDVPTVIPDIRASDVIEERGRIYEEAHKAARRAARMRQEIAREQQELNDLLDQLEQLD